MHIPELGIVVEYDAQHAESRRLAEEVVRLHRELAASKATCATLLTALREKQQETGNEPD
jgi:hypothetical protein